MLRRSFEKREEKKENACLFTAGFHLEWCSSDVPCTDTQSVRQNYRVNGWAFKPSMAPVLCPANSNLFWILLITFSHTFSRCLLERAQQSGSSQLFLKAESQGHILLTKLPVGFKLLHCSLFVLW